MQNRNSFNRLKGKTAEKQKGKSVKYRFAFFNILKLFCY